MTRSDSPEERPPLRERVRAAGGWYEYLNNRLVKYAGPAAVGPYDAEPPPSPAETAQRPCPICRRAIAEHTFDRSGTKPLMHCPA